MNSLLSPKAKRGSVGRPLLAAGTLLLALAACKPVDRQAVVGAVPDDYRLAHPISVEESVDTMDVPVGMNTQHLSAGVRANVQGFAVKFINSRSAVIAIVAPRGSGNQSVAGWMSGEVKDVLIGAGVNPRAIEMRTYHADRSEATAPIRLAYARMAAQTAGCGPWTKSMIAGNDNKNYQAFGCASQQNLAAIVDNPLDLLYPRATTPPDAARRTKVLDNYRNGIGTQGDYSKEGGGQIVQGVGN